jgi:hypothetical protein
VGGSSGWSPSFAIASVRALNVVVVVLMACVIVAAKPLSIDRGSISLSNLRVLGHEIAVGHAHFSLDTSAREGANVTPASLNFASTILRICVHAYMHRVALGVKRCGLR